MISASSTPTYGSVRVHQRRACGSHNMNAAATGPSSAMLYFEIIPMPRQMPAYHQARA